jgi:hypothetical protein
MKKVMGSLFQRPRSAAVAIILAFVAVLSGCAGKIPHTLVPEYEKRNIKLVAVLPSLDKAGNPEMSALLRQRIVEALYFKGYKKVPTNAIDEKMAAFYKNVKEPTVNALPPRDVGGILGVDAVLYSTLKNCKSTVLYLYAPTSVAVSFEMYNTRTGELLWSTVYQTSESTFDISPDRVKMKTYQIFEPALQQIVNKAMETLPDGPDS